MFQLISVLLFFNFTIGFLYFFVVQKRFKKFFGINYLFLALAFELIICVLFYFILSEYKWPWIYRLSFPFELAVISLVYLYIKDFVYFPSIQKIKLSHSLPFIFGFLWYFSFLISADSAFFEKSNLFYIEKYFRTFVIFIVSVFYLIKTYKLINFFKIQAEQSISDFHAIRIPWIKSLIAVYLLFSLGTLLDLLSGPLIVIWALDPLITTISLCLLLYHSLSLSNLYHSNLIKEADIIDVELSKDNKNSDEFLKYEPLIRKALEEDKIYLKSQLKLNELAEATKLKSYQVTGSIKTAFNSNFYELINDFRIQHAAKMMQDKSKSHYSLLAIANESGFNSKTTFNEFFKKRFKMTPSEYRKQISQ